MKKALILGLLSIAFTAPAMASQSIGLQKISCLVMADKEKQKTNVDYNSQRLEFTNGVIVNIFQNISCATEGCDNSLEVTVYKGQNRFETNVSFQKDNQNLLVRSDIDGVSVMVMCMPSPK